MKISSKSWKSYIDRLSKIDKKAADTVANFYRENPGISVEQLIGYCLSVADYYGNAAGELACEMYEEVAIASGKAIPTPEPARTATYGEMASAIRGTLLQSQNPDAIGAVVGRKVKTVSLDTILKNSLRDGAYFAWIPSGDTCAYCIMLASNGWQRASKKALKNGHASHVHNNCDCTYAIRFDDDTEVEGYDDGKAYKTMYDLEGIDPEIIKKYEKEHGPIGSYKDRLNIMRQAQYSANPEKYRAQNKNNYIGSRVRKLFDTLPTDSVVEELRNEYNPWVKSLSGKELHAIEKYTKNELGDIGEAFYSRLNAMLRGDGPSDAMLQEYAETISGALKKKPLQKKVAAYRGMDADAFGNFKAGDSFPGKQFISSSVIPSKAFNSEYKAVIIAPTGTNCAYLDQISGFPNQRELLFDKDCDYRVIYNHNKLTILEVIV